MHQEDACWMANSEDQACLSENRIIRLIETFNTFHNVHKFLDRYSLANSADLDQTSP